MYLGVYPQPPSKPEEKGQVGISETKSESQVPLKYIMTVTIIRKYLVTYTMWKTWEAETDMDESMFNSDLNSTS